MSRLYFECLFIYNQLWLCVYMCMNIYYVKYEGCKCFCILHNFTVYIIYKKYVYQRWDWLF